MLAPRIRQYQGNFRLPAAAHCQRGAARRQANVPPRVVGPTSPRVVGPMSDTGVNMLLGGPGGIFVGPGGTAVKFPPVTCSSSSALNSLFVDFCSLGAAVLIVSSVSLVLDMRCFSIEASGPFRSLMRPHVAHRFRFHYDPGHRSWTHRMQDCGCGAG
jgi:hypothetical protein